MSGDGTGEGEVAPIPNEALRVEHLPQLRDPFDAIVRFAYTFDGYERFGMQLCGEMANRAAAHFYREKELPGWIEADLDRLRGALFFEARRWILLEREPDVRALFYIHALIERIGAAVAQRPG